MVVSTASDSSAVGASSGKKKRSSSSGKQRRSKHQQPHDQQQAGYYDEPRSVVDGRPRRVHDEEIQHVYDVVRPRESSTADSTYQNLADDNLNAVYQNM